MSKSESELDQHLLFNQHKPSESDIIIYEVNLSFNVRAYETHKEWMLAHIEDMVKVNQFIKVQINHQLNLDPIDDSHMRTHKLTARYYIQSYQQLLDYLKRRARSMRNQVLEKFMDQYSVSRRVFVLTQEYDAQTRQAHHI